MPLHEYSLMDRILGNLIVSFILSLSTVLFLLLLNTVGVPIQLNYINYLIFPCYFVLLTVFSEKKVRSEKKNGIKETA